MAIASILRRTLVLALCVLGAVALAGCFFQGGTTSSSDNPQTIGGTVGGKGSPPPAGILLVLGTLGCAAVARRVGFSPT